MKASWTLISGATRRLTPLLFCGLLVTPAIGQTAGMVSFQGLIRDGAGKLINGDVVLRFRIFDAETAGNLVDMDGDGVVEDTLGEDLKESPTLAATNGIVAAKFGPVSAKAFNGKDRWLEVSVDDNADGMFEALSRVEMVTAPATAEQLNIPATGDPAIQIDQDGDVGIGTTPIGPKLHVAHAESFRPALSALHSGNGQAAQFQSTDPTSNFPTVFIKNEGNSSALKIEGSLIGGPGSGIDVTVFGSGDAVRATNNGTGYAGYFEGQAYFSGDVGIGTTTPTATLDVTNTGGLTAIQGKSSWIGVFGSHNSTSGTFPGVWGETDSLSSGATALRGIVTSTAPGSNSSGVLGKNNGTSSKGIGVRGTHAGSGIGVSGEASTLGGIGIKGVGWWGVHGTATLSNGYGGVFGGSGGLGSGQALLVLGDTHHLSNVGIGTTNIPAGVRLAVDGKVLCEEVEVQLSQFWPDYVFEDGYDLMPLDELDTYIRERKHLPAMPSADEVATNGIALGHMQAQLLEKVEELTLYVLAMNRQLGTVMTENSSLRQRISSLEASGD